MRLAGLDGINCVLAVVGCQRSGTTLTGHILGAHPRAVLIDEEDGLYEWFHAAASGASDAGDLLSSVLERAAGKYADPATRFRTDGARATRLSPALTHLVLKAPNLSWDWAALSRIDPPARIVYPVRHPVHVVASMARLKHIDFIGAQARLLEAHPQAAATFPDERQALADRALSAAALRAIIWRLKSGLADRFSAAGLPVLQFRYEDLTAAPQRVCRDLAAFAGLDFDPAMLAHGGVFTGTSHGRTERSRPIQSEPLHKPTDGPGKDRRAEILRQAGSLATGFGYA